MNSKKTIRCNHIYYSKGMTDDDNLLKIAICDRRQNFSLLLMEKIQEILKEENLLGTIDNYLELEELKNNEKIYDIIFIFIDSFCINDFLILNNMKKENDYSKFILISKTAGYMQDAYRMQVYRYLLMDDTKDKIKEGILSAVCENLDRKGIIFENNGVFYKIYIKDIIYVEALGDEIAFVTKRQEHFILRMTLKSVYSKLNCEFARCSREKIVNVRHIKKIKGREVILDNEMKITLSYREKCNVREEYINYLFRIM